MNGGEMQSSDIETENFGVKVTQKIAEYIRNQLKEDAEQSQLTMDFDPFTGNR